jgi:hypothetical protein
MYGSALIKIVFDEPVSNSMEKYGEMLYKQKQIRYGSEGELTNVVFEDLTEPQRRTEEDFFQQFIGQRVSFTTTRNETVNDVIKRVGSDGIYVEDRFFRYESIINLPTPASPPTAVATEIPIADAEIIRPPTVPIVEARVVPKKKGFFSSLFGNFGKGKHKSKKQKKQRKSKKQRKHLKTRK